MRSLLLKTNKINFSNQIKGSAAHKAAFSLLDYSIASAGDGLTYSVSAENYFTGAGINSLTSLNYDSINNVVYLQGITPVIPEPGTATLSLLALAGLAVRRRRK